MTAGVRGILTAASILGHPLDTGGYPRVCRSGDWGLLTRLAPGYQVAGSDEERMRQAERIKAIRELAGGAKFLSGISASSPPVTLTVAGAIPGGRNVDIKDIEHVGSAVAACLQITSLTGTDWNPGLPIEDKKNSDHSDWRYLAGLLESTKIPCVALPALPESIDQAIFKGTAVISNLKSGNGSDPNISSFTFTVITSIITSQELGTLARIALATPDSEARVVDAEVFEQTLDSRGVVAMKNPVFEGTSQVNWSMPGEIPEKEIESKL